MNRLFTSFLLLFLASATTQAAVTLTMQFSPNLIFGSDNGGFVGSTWTFTAVISQPTYGNLDDEPEATTTTASLNISGSSIPANNGTFTISENDLGDFVYSPNLGGSSIFLADSTGQASEFNIRTGVTVSGFGFIGAPVSTPSIGDPVKASDFNGSSSLAPLTFVVDGGTYNYPAGTSISAVPEPSTYAILAGLGVLGVVCLLRRKRTA